MGAGSVRSLPVGTYPMIRIVILLLAAMAAAAGDWTPVTGHVPPVSGEHPRLFLRKADMPALRERAQTPEGKAIVARLRMLLGGGEAVPGQRNTGGRFDSSFDGPLGSYTLWHAAGFGTLYQITGEVRYAALARECAELAWSGVRDRDSRYCLKPPAEPMRGGPSIYAMALAYDLCYDGWDPAYREDFAKRMLAWSGNAQKRGGEVSIRRMATRADNPNRVSNHFALQVGGAGLALLALNRDPGVDQAQVDQLMQGVAGQARKVLNEDFGQGGYFGEHAGPGVIAMTWTFIPWLQAERVAGGRDWLPGNPAAEWMTLRFPMQMVGNGSQPRYFNIGWASGPGDENHGYGMEVVPQDGGHHGALFCQGFGAVRPEYRPAMLWAYNTFMAPYEAKRFPGQAPQGGLPAFDVFTYPHRALFALVNWPIGVEPQNPGEVLPPVAQDQRYGQYVHRNRWQDEDDIVVGVLYGARTSHGEASNNRLQVTAYRRRIAFSTVTGREGTASGCEAAADGSGVSWGNGHAVGVDFSGAAGCEAVVVHAGGGANATIAGENGPVFKSTTVTVGGQTVAVLTVAKGEHPAVTVDGQAIAIGKQSITIADGRPRFAVIAGPWSGPRFRSPEQLAPKPVKAGEPPVAKGPGPAKPRTAGTAALTEAAKAAEPAMRDRLLTQLAEASSRPAGVTAQIAMFRAKVRLAKVVGRDLTFEVGEGSMAMPFDRLTPDDRANLAVAVRRPKDASAAALAAFWLLAAGRVGEADPALADAGAEAEAVRKLFSQ